jgi:hypothetical protein
MARAGFVLCWQECVHSSPNDGAAELAERARDLMTYHRRADGNDVRCRDPGKYVKQLSSNLTIFPDTVVLGACQCQFHRLECNRDIRSLKTERVLFIVSSHHLRRAVDEW